MNKRGESGDLLVFMAIVFCLIMFIAGIYAMKAASPWWSSTTGQAELAQAEQNRQIVVLEATAKKEASVQLALAEVERAKGVAEANRIIGESLKENEDYLKYLWITDVAGANIDKTVVYIPTEVNLPILEANRLK